MEKNIAIIFAGGTGQRFGAEIPKQFIKIYGKEIIIQTLEKFQNNPEIDEIYIGCIEEWIPFLEHLLNKYNINKVPENGIVSGGNTGQDTIYRILSRARENNSEDSIVLINDGVRPNITDREIHENIESVKENGTAITCIPFQETPVLSADGVHVDATLDRNQLYRGVAPQSFRLGHILDAHELIRENDLNYEKNYGGAKIVDSASLITVAFGERCAIVEGNPNNIKVTNMDDFFSQLGLMQKEDIWNYFMTQNNSPMAMNESLMYGQSLSDSDDSRGGKVKKLIKE